VTELLNYISAWLTFLTAVFALCLFFFELVSKKRLVSYASDIKKSWLTRALNKKKSFFVTARYFLPAARQIEKRWFYPWEEKNGLLLP